MADQLGLCKEGDQNSNLGLGMTSCVCLGFDAGMLMRWFQQDNAGKTTLLYRLKVRSQ